MVELVRRGLPQERIDKIYDAHARKLSVRDAAEFAGVDVITVRRYWGMRGLKPNYISGREYSLPQEKIDKLLEAHKQNLSQKAAAAFAGIGDCKTVRKYWTMYGLGPTHPPGWDALPHDKIDKILEAHKRNLSLSEAAEFAGISSGSVWKYWKQNGLKANYHEGGEYQRLSQDKINKVIEAHKRRLSLEKAAEYAGVSTTAVIKYWKENGLKPHYNLYKIGLLELMDGVFDTRKNPGEELTLEQITVRLVDRLGLKRNRINEADLREKIAHLALTGMYKSTFRYEGDKQVEYFSAGMPKAMDGMLGEEE